MNITIIKNQIAITITFTNDNSEIQIKNTNNLFIILYWCKNFDVWEGFKTAATRKSLSNYRKHSQNLQNNKAPNIAENAFSLNLNFRRILVFKTLQLKINNFPLISVLPIRQYVTYKINFLKDE